MKVIKSYKWFFLSILSFLIAWGSYEHFFSSNFNREVGRVQKGVNAIADQLSSINNQLMGEVEYMTSDELWLNYTHRFAQNDAFIYILKNDTLAFWNGNSLPINSDVSFINEGISFQPLGNGDYLFLKHSFGEFTLISSKLIKRNYAYQNQYLTNNFSDDLGSHIDLGIGNVSCDACAEIFSQDSASVLFYVYPMKEPLLSQANSEILVFIFYCLALVFLFSGVAELMIRKLGIGLKSKLMALILLLLIPIVIGASWKGNPIHDFFIFNPNLYASSEVLASFGHLMYYMLFIGVFVWWVFAFLPKQMLGKYMAYLVFVGLFPLGFCVTYVFQSLIVNSTIHLEIDRLFSLNGYSLLGLLIIGALIFIYILVVIWVVSALRAFERRFTAVIWFLLSAVYFIFEVFFNEAYFMNALFPGLVTGIFLIVPKLDEKPVNFLHQTLLVAFFALVAAVNIFEYNQLNELQKRALFAHQLVSDKDAATEAEFLELEERLRNSNLFERYEEMLLEEETLDRFPDLFEACCLDRFWERYELTYFLFEGGNSIYPDIAVPGATKSELNRVVEKHGIPSEFSNQLYHIYDNYDRLSYIAQIEVDEWVLYIRLQSKRIPEQIGFPRILINQSALVIEELEEYSIARYYGGKLVMRFGAFNYPLLKHKLTEKWNNANGDFSSEGMSHYSYTDSENQTIIISKPNKSWLENVTIFSYLFIFFGTLILLFNLIFMGPEMSFTGLNLSFKIQVVMISLLVGSFLVFGVVTGAFVKNQYNSFTLENIQEKLYSVEIEVKQKLGENVLIDRLTMGNYLDYILKKFANVFATDINFYDKSGGLLATSQPRLYAKEITGLQMNSMAFFLMKHRKSSEFIHQESIGELDYLSAYMPLMNNDGNLLGYLNLQHFSKQNVYESQLSGFIVTIINIAVLFLVISVIVAIFLSNWLTLPLRLIQQSIRTIELGKQNNPINYKGNDELGALVKEYNLKLEELELNAMQLARSERESAWREMAKQVAHEIKNPLTPMKLSLQHFQRSFNPEDPDAKEKINRISASLVEQINTLTGIANEFSSFAKMPQPNEETIDLVELLRNVIQIFDSEADGIGFATETPNVWVFADKDLMIRAFNNLIKNAIQAIPEGRKPSIHIRLSRDHNHIVTEITDNGSGIASEQRSKIFVPNFTTKSTGAGLGLAMVRQIIDNHNGEIWFESQEGFGTTFFVRLPIKQPTLINE